MGFFSARDAALVILGMIVIDFAFDSAVLFNLHSNAPENAKIYYGAVRSSYVVKGFIPAFMAITALVTIANIIKQRNLKSILSFVALLGMGGFFVVFLEPPQESLASLSGAALIPPLINIAYGHLILAAGAIAVAIIL